MSDRSSMLPDVDENMTDAVGGMMIFDDKALMRRHAVGYPSLVAPAPAVYDVLHAAATDHGGMGTQGRGLSPAAPIGGEPRGVPGLNEGVFYPPETSSRGLRPAPSPMMRRRSTTGMARCLVLLVDFDDNPGTRPAADIQDMLFSQGTYATRSLRDYYQENSYGQLDVDGLVLGWLRMPQLYAYYTDGQRGLGAYPRNTQKLVEDALAVATQQVDLRQFDADGDLFVDGLFVVHAGSGAETVIDPARQPAAIWSHQWNTSLPVVSNGITAYAYCTTPEDGRIGVFCHEFGHMLGLPDLYDTTYRSTGVGQWCVMGTGSWNDGGRTPGHLCAWAKARLGWIAPAVVTGAQVLQLQPIEQDKGGVYRLWTGGAVGSDYLLIEARQAAGFDHALPGAGLLIWRIDEAQRDNTHPGAYLVGLEQADGRHDLELGRNSGDAGDPYPGSTQALRYDAATAPNFDPQRHRPYDVTVTDIADTGGAIMCQVTV